MKLVLVEWFDSHSGREGWKHLGELKKQCEPLHCRSVGWLVADENGHKVIVPHLSGEDNEDIIICGKGELTIPNKAIKKMTVLRGKAQ